MGRLRYDSSGRLLLFEEGVPPIPTGAGGAIAAGGTGTLPTKTTRSLLDDAAGAECCCAGAGDCAACCTQNYIASGTQQCCYVEGINAADQLTQYRWYWRRREWRTCGTSSVRLVEDLEWLGVMGAASAPLTHREAPQLCFANFPATWTFKMRQATLRFHDCFQTLFCDHECSGSYTGGVILGPDANGRWRFTERMTTSGGVFGLILGPDDCPDCGCDYPLCIPDESIQVEVDQAVEDAINAAPGGDCSGWILELDVDERDEDGAGFLHRFELTIVVDEVVEDCTSGCTLCP